MAVVANDPFPGLPASPDHYDDGGAVTPSDTDDLPNVASALYVGGAGNISILTAKGTALTLNSVPVGILRGIRVRRVKSAGTTATDLVWLA